ncbi:MAG: hypothetical protein FWD77_11130 [Betaproteobacteria bacterium]|nr:hypothetical protein [Betaproteobacteria bacterium]
MPRRAGLARCADAGGVEHAKTLPMTAREETFLMAPKIEIILGTPWISEGDSKTALFPERETGLFQELIFTVFSCWVLRFNAK